MNWVSKASAHLPACPAILTCRCLVCRQMFANAQLARMAAEKELEEAQGRTDAQHALANARAQAAQRALVVAKEKASNEAKSEFMSLMCHEVRHCKMSSFCRLTWRLPPAQLLQNPGCS